MAFQKKRGGQGRKEPWYARESKRQQDFRSQPFEEEGARYTGAKKNSRPISGDRDDTRSEKNRFQQERFNRIERHGETDVNKQNRSGAATERFGPDQSNQVKRERGGATLDKSRPGQERFNRTERYGMDMNKQKNRDRVRPERFGPDQNDRDAQRLAGSQWTYPRPAPPSWGESAQKALQDDAPLIIYGRNPVREAIKSGRSIDKVFVVDTGHEDGSLREIVRMARERNLVIATVVRARLDTLTLPYGYGGKSAHHQGIAAQMPEVEYVEIPDILQKAKDRGEPPFVLVLDAISDPHNLGAILRTAECAGVHGVIIPKRRAVSVTAAVAKASAGAAMHVNVARVPNLGAAVEQLKKEGLWILGAQMGEQEMKSARMDGALALVIGGEGEGISPGLQKHCDLMVSIPMFGQMNSLNASTAAAILLYEKIRQDGK